MKPERCKQNTQKQPSIDVLRKSCFIEIALRHGFYPVKLLHIFRRPFPKNTYGGLLLEIERLFHQDDNKDISRKRNTVRKLTICKMKQGILNSFVPNAPFLYPLKRLKKEKMFKL